MKASDLERKKFDKALDVIIELFNNLENDEPIINFKDDVWITIQKAKKKYGDEMVDEKLNTIVMETLSWLELEDVVLEEEEEATEEEE
ncbi:atypical membrane-integrating protein (Mistic protein) [Salirhabdus sp. Marseille-P4669]|uniref:atypical membrane-integrating protein (Mistic protein) n=1 Tax=Salirhabdus sp. Marseille-P4669 TaxID=2042310 RepID=UPI001357BD46|nr:atypical membrane-integrating protein (Mistic protein) [Salirhabdus sp. Marseille-P4669]